MYTVTFVCLFAMRLGFWKLFHSRQAKLCPNLNMVDLSQVEHCLKNEDSGLHTNWFRQSMNECQPMGYLGEGKGHSPFLITYYV